MNEFQKFQQFLKDGQRYSKTTNTKNFTVKRFLLDTAASEGTKEGNVFEQSFLSFWVVDTNNIGFRAKMHFSDASNSGDALPLQLNMAPGFEYPVDGCFLTWDAQPGTWVDIVFAHGTQINVGNNTTNIKGLIVTSDGSNYNHDNFTATNEPAEILARDDNRGVSTIFNYSSEVLFLGREEMLSGEDYQTKAIRCYPNEFIKWRNSDELFCRTMLAEVSDVAILNERA